MSPQALIDTGTRLLTEVLAFRQPADAVVSAFFRAHPQIGSRERQRLADAVFHVVRHKPVLEWQLQTTRSLMPGSVRALLLLGLAADPAWVAAALSPAEQVWWNALAAWPVEQAPPSLTHCLPAWLEQRLREQLGDETSALAQALLRPAPLDVRVNTLKARRPAVLQALAGQGLPCEITPYAPQGIRLSGHPSLQRVESYRRGDIEVQDEGSQLLSLLVAPRRHEVVVDLCAGAGGKTLALGAAMRDTGRLYACDTSAHRLDALRPRLQRSGLTLVYPMAIAHENDERLRRLDGKVDRVLVDAPCSGLGTLRRSPDLKWRVDAGQIEALAAVQRRILESAVRLLKPGGRLVYATCSVLREENEAVALAFAEGRRDLQSVPVQPLLEQAGVPGAADLVQDAYLRLWPHRHGTDGFFAAVWQRVD